MYRVTEFKGNDLIIREDYFNSLTDAKTACQGNCNVYIKNKTSKKWILIGYSILSVYFSK